MLKKISYLMVLFFVSFLLVGCNERTITYDANGGHFSDGSSLKTFSAYHDKDRLPKPDTPTRAGYAFDGWYENYQLTKPLSADTVNGSQKFYAKWTLASYTVTFHNTTYDPVTVLISQALSKPHDPAKEGYVFAGWYTDPNFTARFDFSTVITANLDLYAKWDIIQYTVTFANTDMAPQKVDYHQTLPMPANPVKAGYVFLGWFTDSALTNQYDFSTTIANDMTLYAEFVPDVNTVRFDTNGGSTVAPIVPAYNTPIKAPAAPAKTGYTFVGWFSDSSLANAYDFNTPVTGNITLYAKWRVNQYTISFDSNGGSDTPSVTNDFGTNVAAPNVPVKTGYTFAGWFSDSSLNTPYTFTAMPAEDITLYAKWDINHYAVTLETNGGAALDALTADYNTTANLPTPQYTGYTFAGWYTDSGLTTPYDTAMKVTGNLTLFAKWNVNQYTLSFDSNGGTDVAAITQNYGSTVTAPTAPAEIGYTFAGWYSDSTLNTPFTFTAMPSENLTLYAKWTVNQYTLSFDSMGGSTVNPITKDYNDPVTPPGAPEKAAYVFAGWYMDETMSTPYLFGTMPADNITLYAKWVVDEKIVTFDSNGGSYIPSQDIVTGQNAAAPQPPVKTGYTFDAWYTDSALTSVYDFSTPVTGDMTLYAGYTVNDYTITYNSEGGTDITPMTSAFGSNITLPTPVQTGYDFKGWYTDSNFTAVFVESTMPAEDLTLYAKWTIRQFTVTFTDSVLGTIGTQTVNYGSTVTKPAGPVKTGYSFSGWAYFNSQNFYLAYQFTTPVTGNLTLYTVWYANIYTITFDSNGGSDVSSITTTYGYPLSAPDTPTKAHYQFAGWYSDSALTQSYNYPETMPAENITLYAEWTPEIYTVVFQTFGSAYETFYVNYNDAVMPPSDPGAEHFTFGGWYTDKGDTTLYDFSTPVDGNMTLYAKMTPDDFTVSFDSDGGSDVTSITQGYQTALTAPESPVKTGYTFIGWYSDSALTVPYTFSTMPAEDITLYAAWQVNVYTMIFDSNGGRDVAPITQNYGSTVNAPTEPNLTGYSFTGWYSDSALTVPYAFSTMPAEDITLYAAWQVNVYTMTFDSNGGVATITQNYGSTVNAPAAPAKTGYTFNGWYSDSALTALYTFSTMPAENLTLYAGWSVNEYTMTFDSNGGTDVAAITQNYGSTVNAPTEPNLTGYSFTGWYSDRALTVPYTFSTMPAEDITLYAGWEINVYTITFDSNGGTDVPPITEVYNTVFSAPLDATRAGYSFAGWYGDSALTTPYTFTAIPAMDITLYAKWQFQPSTGIVYTLSDTGDYYKITDYTGTDTEVNIPGYYEGLPIEVISSNAFNGKSISSVVFEDNSVLNEIDDYAFSYTQITSITLPASVSLLFYAPFSDCYSLMSINADPNSPYFKSVDGVLYSYDLKTLVFYPAGLSASFTVPDNVETIGVTAFFGTQVTEVTFTENSQLSLISTSAFYLTPNLQTLIFESLVPPATIDAGALGGGYVIYVPNSALSVYKNLIENSYLGTNNVYPYYTLTFNSNGGSAVTSEMVFETTDGVTPALATEPPAPTQTGSTFTGWYSDSACTTLFDFNNSEITDDLTLYAGWSNSAPVTN